MRATYVRKIRTDYWATHAAAGETITHSMREIAALLGGRAAQVLGFVLQVKTVFDVDAQHAYGFAELIDAVHGQIQLSGPHGTGLVPVNMRASDIASLNCWMGFPSSFIAGRPGGLAPAATYAAQDTAIESSLVLAYSERAFSGAPIGHGSIYDGAIDASLFGPSTTLTVTGIGAAQNAAADVFKTTYMDIYVVYSTAEPGQYLLPCKPIYRRLGSIQNDPQVFGLGQRSDLRCVVLTTEDVTDQSDDQAAIRASAAMASLELDGVEITEGPGRVISRCANVMGVGACATAANNSYEPQWAPLLSPCQVPQASERHVGATLQFEGMNLLDQSSHYPIANAYYVQAPDRETINEVSRLRQIDPEKLVNPRLAGNKAARSAGLSAERSVGMAPTVE